MNVINSELPTLRSRGEDVLLLASHFLQNFSRKNGKSISGFTPEAAAALQGYSWPGNVRELENAVERAVVLSKEDLIDTSLLPTSVLTGPQRYSKLDIGVGVTLREAEMALIQATLDSVGGDKETAARILGIAARTIYRKLQ